MGDGRSGREGADQHPGQYVAKDDGLTQLPRQHAAANGGQKNVGEIPEKQGAGFQ
jgi:hypothetical protein